MVSSAFSSEIFVDGLHPVSHVQFLVNMINVFAYGLLADVQVGSDLLIEEPAGKLLQDLVLAV